MNQLKQKRTEKGLSQSQIAEQAKINVRLYQRYEYDEREPKARLAIQIAKVLNTTVEELYSPSNFSQTRRPIRTTSAYPFGEER